MTTKISPNRIKRAAEEESQDENSAKINPNGKLHLPNEDKHVEEVKKKAYELYEKKGCKNGDDWHDWFTAEQLLRGDYYL